MFYDSGSRQSCGCYGSPQHLDPHRAPRTVQEREAIKAVGTTSFLSFPIFGFDHVKISNWLESQDFM